MVVLTFTGRAVADAQPLARAADIVAREAGPRAVVAPPLAGIPQRLDQMLGFVAEGRVRAARALLARVIERHRGLIAPASAGDALHAIDELQSELERLLATTADTGAGPTAGPGVPPIQVGARFQAAASVLSAVVVVAALRQAGLAAVRVDAAGMLEHVLPYRRGTLTAEEVTRIARQIAPAVDRGAVPVIAGGVVADANGTFAIGDDGVMWSAAVLSAAMRARELQMWTDADGVLAADPSLVPWARRVPQLSFAEALELARAGARDLHAAPLELAALHGTPVVVRSVRSPQVPGTVINGQPSVNRDAPAALACRRGAVALQLSARGSTPGSFVERILDWSRDQEDVTLVAPVSGTAVIAAFGGPGVPERASASVRDIADVTRLDDVAVLSAVGEGLASNPDVVSGVLGALDQVTVHAHARHPSARSIAMVLDDADAEEAMQRVYARFFGKPEPSAAPSCAGGAES